MPKASYFVYSTIHSQYYWKYFFKKRNFCVIIPVVLGICLPHLARATCSLLHLWPQLLLLLAPTQQHSWSSHNTCAGVIATCQGCDRQVVTWWAHDCHVMGTWLVSAGCTMSARWVRDCHILAARDGSTAVMCWTFDGVLATQFMKLVLWSALAL